MYLAISPIIQLKVCKHPFNNNAQVKTAQHGS